MGRVFLSSITFAGGSWTVLAVIAACVLVPLAWAAIRSAGRPALPVVLGAVLRCLGIALVLLCLLEPEWVEPRAKRGANLFAVVADNSQGLQIKEDGAASSRGETLRAVLTDATTGWSQKLADEFQVRNYVFDRNLRRVADFAALDHLGDRSSLHRALEELRTRFAGQPLAGVLLFTDGNATDLAASSLDLHDMPPIYPVMVGRTGGTRDVRIERAEVRQTAFDDAPVSVRATISAQRADGATVAVKLIPLALATRPPDAAAAAELPAAQSLRIQGSVTPQEARFDWRPTGSGVQFFELLAEPAGLAGEEATLLNNRRRILIDRGRTAYRILYVGGRPSWEYKFLNRSLAEDPQLQMVGLIRVARREPKFEFKGHANESVNPLFRGFGRADDETARYDQPVLVRVSARDENELRGGFPSTPEELFAYDAIVVDDMEASFFTRDQQELLRRFASERGGGLLFLGGADSLNNGGYAGTPVAAALPVYLDRASKAAPQGELTWNLTREGWVEPWVRVRAAEGDEQQRLAQMPKFQTLNTLDAIKPGATALANVRDEAGTTFPALVSQRYGAGRVATLLLGDVWRWGMRQDEGQLDLARFWRQMARWLVTDAPPQVALRVEKSADGEGVTFRAVVRDRAFQPLDAAQVNFAVQRNDAKPAPGTGAAFAAVTLPGDPIPDRPGEYTASLSLRDAGAYLVDVYATQGAGERVGHAQAGWVNDPLADEFAALDPNENLLSEIARRTGGRVVAMSELSRFVEQLPQHAAPIMETRAWPLWQQSSVLLIVLACFLAEWWLRRRKGLA